MKSEIVTNNQDEDTRKYPWLGINSDGTVVLFLEGAAGVVVDTCGKYSPSFVGEYDDFWFMDDFTEFKGKVILSND